MLSSKGGGGSSPQFCRRAQHEPARKNRGDSERDAHRRAHRSFHSFVVVVMCVFFLRLREEEEEEEEEDVVRST